MELLADNVSPKGRVEIFTCRGKPKLTLLNPVVRVGRLKQLEDAGRIPRSWKEHDLDFSECDLLESQDVMNIIVNQGKDTIINSLETGFIHPIVRLAVGDRGTIPSDPTVPKIAQATQTGLFNEIYRANLDATLVETTASAHRIKFIKTVAATDIPLTYYSNQANPVINEAGLITADLIGGDALSARQPSYRPADAAADEKLFAMRTFKSVPFDASTDISVTIRYTIFIE